MEDANLAIIVDAKSEYTKQLVNILKGNVYFGIKNMYTSSKQYCIENNNTINILSHFQSKLEEVPEWSQKNILSECQRVIDNSKCDWLEELITAVFVSHTRILSSINFSKNKKQINLKIPKVDHFIHQCFIDCARIFYKCPYLLDDTISNYEYQKNRNECERLIEKSIEETVRKQLPVKHILQEYLGNNYTTEETNEETKTEEEEETKNIEQELETVHLEPTIIEELSNKEEPLEPKVPEYTESAKEVNFEIEDEEQPKVSELNMNIRELVKNEIEKTKNELESSNSEQDIENIKLSLENPESKLESEVTNNVDLDLGLSNEKKQDTIDYNNDFKIETLGELDMDNDLDIDLDENVKVIDLNNTNNESETQITNSDEVKTIVLDTKNNLSDEDLEKKQHLRSKKSFNFFNDSIEEEM